MKVKKIVLFSLTLLCLNKTLLGQLWQHNYSTGVYRYATCIAEAYDGGYLMTAINGNGISGQHQGFVYKLDIDGNILWQKTIADFTDIFRLFTVCPTYEGGFLLGGYCLKYDPGGAAFIMKFNECAERQWTKEYGIYNNYEFVNIVRQTSDSNYISSAQFFGNGLSADSGRVGLLKVDSYGDTLWLRDYTHFNNAGMLNFHLTHDNGYYITGVTQIPYQRSQAIKIDSAGNEQWNRLYGTNNFTHHFLIDAIETSDSGYLNLEMRGVSSYKHWNYLIKTDAYGNEQWGKFISDTNDLSERPVNIHKMNDSTAIIICNTSYSYTPTTHEVYNIKLIKIDMMGNVLDSVRFINGDNNAQNSIVSTDGDIVLCGIHDTGFQWGALAWKITPDLVIDTMLNIIFNYDTLCNYSITNSFIPYDTTTVGMEENNNITNENITAYPNPFTEQTEIRIKEPVKSGNTYFVAYNIIGEECLKIKLNIGQNHFMIKNRELNQGFYLGKLVSDHKILDTIKLIHLN